MGEYGHDADDVAFESQFDREFVDLALSVNAAVRWSYSLADDEITWRSGMDSLLGMPRASHDAVRARLRELTQPLMLAAATAPVWQDLELEQPLVRADGNERYIRFRARRFGESRTGGLIGIASDVTVSHDSSHEIADRYRLLVELSPEAICVHQDEVITYVNPSGIRMMVADSEADIVGKSVTEFVTATGLAEVQSRVSELTAPGAASVPSEIELMRLDGGSLAVEAVSVRTTWEGRPAFQVIMRDITAQRAAEAALHYQAALVEYVSDAIIATTGDGVVTSWNPAAEAVYGIAASDAIGRAVGDVVGATLDPEAVLEAGGITQVQHRRRDGSLLNVRLSAAQMHDGYVLMCADETAKRRAEQHYATVVSALDEGVIVVGASGFVESANPAAQRILGMGGDEIIGRSPGSWLMFEESGAALMLDDYPSVQAQRSGQAQDARTLRGSRADGSSVWLAVSSRPLMPNEPPPCAVVTSFTDVTETKAIHQRLEQEATQDPLTGLANRTLVLRWLSTALDSPQQTAPSQQTAPPQQTAPSRQTAPSQQTAVLFIDVDNFKVINDSLGHSAGDSVLRVIGDRLAHTVHSDDLVGRIGGDEFVVVTHKELDTDAIGAFADQLRDALTDPVTVSIRQLHVDASMGIVMTLSGDDRSAEDLLRDADVAMYKAKDQGRGRYAFFDVHLRERMQWHMQLEQDLRDAVRADELWMAYQPLVDLRSDRPVGVEGLLRWTHPTHGSVSPGEFVPVAEESDLIKRIGAHVLSMCTSDLARLRERERAELRMNVNLSARQLDDPNLLAAVRAALAEADVPAHALCFEVTESALMRDAEAASGILGQLRELGATLAIDDFGTGYSSLGQLRRLPLDALKIDRSFVAPLGESQDSESIVTSIIAMAHAVDLTVVAEGVETAEQLMILRRLGCDQAQGFYLGRPAPINELSMSQAAGSRSAGSMQ